MTVADHLTKILARKKIKKNAFAKLAGCSPGFVTDVAKGRRCPSIDDAPKWADALGLQDPERREFLEAVDLWHSPSTAQALIVTLRSELLKEQAERLRLFEEHLRLKEEHMLLLTYAHRFGYKSPKFPDKT